MTRNEAAAILAAREGTPPEQIEGATDAQVIAAAQAPAGQPCADCGALVVWFADSEWRHVNPSTCFLASGEEPITPDTADERRSLLIDLCDEEHESAIRGMSDAEVLAMLHDFGWTPESPAAA